MCHLARAGSNSGRLFQQLTAASASDSGVNKKEKGDDGKTLGVNGQGRGPLLEQSCGIVAFAGGVFPEILYCNINIEGVLHRLTVLVVLLFAG